MKTSKLGVALGIVMLLLAVAPAQAVFPATNIGAQVTGIWPGSPAMRAGLEVGDVIVAINNRPVRSMQEYLARMAAAPQANLLVRDVRTGQYVNRFVLPVNGKIGIRLLIAPVPVMTATTVVVAQPVVVPLPMNLVQPQP